MIGLARVQLVQRLSSVTGLPAEAAERVIEEILDIFGQSLEEFIDTRHRILQREGYSSTDIYRRIQEEIEQWRFRSKPLSLRQIRRRIHG